MPKVKIVCLILATVLASVGTILVLTNLNGGEIPPLDVPDTDVNTYLDKPADGTIDDVTDVRENLFIAHKVLLMRSGFYGVSEGATTSFGISQQVLNTRYVVGEFGKKNSFKQMVTKGVVPNAYQLYMWGDNYLFRNFEKVNALDNVVWKNTANKLEKQDFEDKFGHRSDKLTGYILNYDTVTSGELEGVDNGIYTFRFALDTVSATAYMRREMVTNGNLNEYPTFAKAEIVVTMDADWNIKTLTTDCEYTAKTMGISARCTEDITETFYDFDGDLPEKDFFEDFFDADYSGVDQEKGALDVLLDIFSPYLNGEDLQVALAVSNGSTQYADGLVSISGLDIADLTKLTVNAKIGNALDVAYVHGDGKLYLKYQDFQASTTIDGIMGLVGTLAPLFGDGVDLEGALGDVDVDSLLANLTFEITDDKCVVSLPLSLAGLDVSAKLYADVSDDEQFTFTHAQIAIGDVEIFIAPQSWSVAERVGSYPEILGLADLIQNGKVSLDASLSLALNGTNYDVDASALIDLATMNLAVDANVGNNGSIAAVYFNNVVYVQYGEVKVKLDTANIGSILALVEKLVGRSVEMQMPSFEITDVLALLSTVTATNVTDGGVVVNLSVGELNCNVYLASTENRWQIDSIAVDYNGIAATIAPSDSFGEVTKPADADDYADVTELLETFVEPIIRIINGESYGASFALNLTVGAKTYLVKGQVALDLHKTLYVKATVFDGNVGIIDAEVIYANGTVYLTFNGINVAFAVGGGNAGVNAAGAIAELLANEQIEKLLENHKEIGELVDRITEIVNSASNFELSQLLAVDFREVITAFAFENGKLSLSLDGTALGFYGLALDVAIATDNGGLAVEISGLQLASFGIDISATVVTDVEPVTIPELTDYVLNLHGTVIVGDVALDLDITADLVNLDVWATAQLNNEIVYLRYVGGVVYVRYGSVAAKLDVTNLGAIVDKVRELLGAQTTSLGAFDGIDLNEILSALSFNLTAEKPCIAIAFGGIEASVNFANVDGVLKFVNVAASFGEDATATVALNGQQASQLDVDGDFVDGNALVEGVLDTVAAYVDADGVTVVLAANVTVDGNAYAAEITLKYNGGLYATLKLSDDESILVTAEIYFVDGTLYFDVNGIRQAIKLNSQQAYSVDGGTLSEIIAKVKAIVAELDVDVLNNIVEYLEQLPEKIANATFSDFISFFQFEDGTLTVGVDLSQIDLNGFTVRATLGQNVTVAIDGLKLASTEISLAASVQNSSEQITAPALETYVSEFRVTVGDFTAYVLLDLYNKTVVGQADLLDGTVAFKYVGGCIYATYGNVGVAAELAEINTLIEAISKFVELPEISVGDVDVVATIKEVLGKLHFEKQLTEDGYSLTFGIDDVTVTVGFACKEGKVTLGSITASIGELNVEATYVEGYSFVGVDTDGYFVDVCELVNTFVDSILALVNAENYAFGVNGEVTLGGNTYTLVANVAISDGNVYASFKLSVGSALMLDGELYVVDNVLYLNAGDLKLKLALNEKSDDDGELTVEEIKQTLQQLVGYNDYLDELIELALDVLNRELADVKFAELLTKLTLAEGKLSLGVNGAQFDLSQFELALSALQDGLQFSLNNLAFNDVKLNAVGNVSAYTGQITAPSGDFTTNLVVAIDQNNTLYANVDLTNKVIKLQLSSRGTNGKITTLDVLYSIKDNIIKITNGKNLHVSADINNIVEIVREIDKIVTEFAGAESSGAFDGLSSLSSIDLKSILATLDITSQGSSAQLTLAALGFNVSATFTGGALSTVVIPVTDGLTLNISTSPVEAKYATFPTDESKYVRIDQVFNDYFYGDGESERGAIDTLIHTNSWKFDFNNASEITITNDDGTVDKYQIAKNSYFAFYYNVAEKENVKLRAKLTVNKWANNKWGEFIILDVAYIDGRIYANYDSNSSNKNVLKATVSLQAIKDCITLLPALYTVVPQLEDIVNDIKNSLTDNSGINIGDLASMFNTVSYNDEKVFTLSLNEGIIEGLGEIYLSAQQFGNVGLQLNEMRLNYNNISVNLSDIVVTASPSKDNDDGTKSFDYVNDYIENYLKVNGDVNAHMNFDSIRELLSGFVITADNADENGNRSFTLQGNVSAKLLGNDVTIGITVYVDIDKNNNVYLAVKIARDASGWASGLIFKDEGGDSYLLLDSSKQQITLARNSLEKHTWCTQNGWGCSNVLHAITKHSKKLRYDYEAKGKLSYQATMTFAEFTADTKTMVNYILELVNFSNAIASPIKDAVGKENTNVYGIEDILKSYTYTYVEAKSTGTFALGADLSPIDSALGDLNLNILHSGNLKDVYYDENNVLHNDDDATLTSLNGSVTMINIMTAKFDFTLLTPTSGLAKGYVDSNNCLW